MDCSVAQPGRRVRISVPDALSAQTLGRRWRRRASGDLAFGLRAAPAEQALAGTVRGRCRPNQRLLLLSLKALPDKEKQRMLFRRVPHGRTALARRRW